MKVMDEYKKTKVGPIPTDWTVRPASQVCELVVDCKNRTPPLANGRKYAVVRTPNVRDGRFVNEDLRYTDEQSYIEWTQRAVPKPNDVLITREAPLGEACLVPSDLDVCLGQRMMLYRPDRQVLDPRFMLYALLSSAVQDNLRKKAGGSTVGHARVDDIKNLEIPLPPRLEQRAIAEALSDVDALIERLDALIAKKRAVKTATMQRLLTGQQRLPGFGDGSSSYFARETEGIPEDWKVYSMEDIAICLDSQRIPLNEKDRSSMSGSIPYCGANGILDYIDDYIFDEDIILLAEDGGHFYEYASRPIAYRMTGKCWVNNHAHVLRARENFSQDYLFYSLVHKDITEHLSSGTRAKLNRSELDKIAIAAPPTRSEQQAMATILSDMDAEIEALEARRDKTQALKQGMMQELLTGRTRLV